MFHCKEDRDFTKGALDWIGRELGAGKGKTLVVAGGAEARLVNRLPGLVGMQLILLNLGLMTF